jgi:hemerythrin-like domain-containing protein
MIKDQNDCCIKSKEPKIYFIGAKKMIDYEFVHIYFLGLILEHTVGTSYIHRIAFASQIMCTETEVEQKNIFKKGKTYPDHMQDNP